MAAHFVKDDPEKALSGESGDAEPNNVAVSRVSRLKAWMQQSTTFEYRGIQPVQPEERTNKRYINIFTFWVAMTLSVLPITFGMLGPLAYGLSLRDSSLVILFFSMLCGLPCAYLSTLGPKTGLRQMSLARYSFGYYLVSIPILLNLATLVGFCVVTDVIGGEILAAVSPHHVSWNIGIAIVGVISWIISALGYKVLHYYERFSCIVALICIVIFVGSGGKHLHQQSVFPAPEASSVMSFGALMAGYYLPWAAISSDFSTYVSPEASPKRIFWYTYAGLIGPSILLLIVGVAIAGAVPNVPSWAAAYKTGSTGEVFGAMLTPLGGFGKFILVMLSLSIIGNLAGTVYAVTLNFQALLPLFTRIPRAVYAAVTTIIMIAVAVKAAESFWANLQNFVGIIGYWSASWVAVLFIEHFYFRKGDATTYDIAIWHDAKALPSGIAAIAAGALSLALAIPSIAQVWYVGPIGIRTGDIGFEMAFAVTSLLYFPFRYLELKLRGRP